MDFEVVRECVQIATQAPKMGKPSGVDVGRGHGPGSPPVCRSLLSGGDRALGDGAAGREPRPWGPGRSPRISDTVLYLAERMVDVPVIVIPCFQLGQGLTGAPIGLVARMYASMYPAVWSFQLALHSRGLGSTLTTATLNNQDIQTLLQIPGDYIQTCLLPVHACHWDRLQAR